MIVTTDAPTYVLNNRVIEKDSAQGVIEQPHPGWVYMHYKGGMYIVLALAKHTESDEDLVLMRNIKHGSYHARPLSVWNTYATGRDGHEYKRFCPTYMAYIVDLEGDRELDEETLEAAATHEINSGFKN